MEGDGETKGPNTVRVRLVFADRSLLAKAQRAEGLRRCWLVINRHLRTVAELCRDITTRFALSDSSTNGILLSMDGFIIPPSESTLIFRDNDEIRVKGCIAKKEKKAVAPPSIQPQIEAVELTNKGTIVSTNGIHIINNGDDATEKKKKKRKRLLPEQTSSKKEQKQVEGPPCSKKKKLKLVANERPATTNERRTSIPAVAAPSQFHAVNQQSNAPVKVSQRNKQAVSIGKCTSTRFYGGPKENVLGACCGNGNQQSLSGYWIPGQARFMSPGAGPSNWQDNGPRSDDVSRARKTWKPRNGYNKPNAHNRATQQWKDSSGLNAINAALKLGNDFTTGKASEKIHPHGEKKNKDKLDFESLDPVPRLPMEGDIIAYRIDIIDSLGCPGLSSFRVGKVIVFDPVLMIIFLLPLPEYPTPDWEMSEFEKDMYKEDGSLEIDFESLVDLRLVKESQINNAPKMLKSGKGKSKSKASSCQDNAGSSLSLLGNDNTVKSAWEVGEASNAKEAAESSWGAWAPSTSRCGASGPSVGHYSFGFGSRVDFSKEWNSYGINNNTNSPWETNVEATNANEGTQAQQNGWDAWEPNTSNAGPSWQRMRQHLNGFRSSGGYSIRGGRRGRGGKYYNRKFIK